MANEKKLPKLETLYFIVSKANGKFLDKTDQLSLSRPFDENVYSAKTEDEAKAKRQALGMRDTASVQEMPRFVRE